MLLLTSVDPASVGLGSCAQPDRSPGSVWRQAAILVNQIAEHIGGSRAGEREAHLHETSPALVLPFSSIA